jgi:SRSO17 transposase
MGYHIFWKHDFSRRTVMERRYQVRYQEMLAECAASPALFQGSLERLRGFAQPFLACLGLPQARVHARTYIAGLLSNLERKNIESIAYRDDQGRRNLQHFIGVSEWDHRALQQELARQVGQQLGEDDGVLVIDPSAFAKKGIKSVGVARQWCGRHGKVENCQLAVYLGYASHREHALVDMRLYLPRGEIKGTRVKFCDGSGRTRGRARKLNTTGGIQK